MLKNVVIQNEEGQSTTEYALILALVSILIIASLSTFGNSLFTMMQDIANMIPTM